ncbi:TB2/DP1, HVA22 family-domain-containing protein [Hysterangium stoloniferum]|nr:TB2/DP1, HVA22 family-domain-containing protein [Hysterangium stoloniferum]
MGLTALASRLLTAWIAFLHPCYASYKALSHRPVSEPELERWVKYWAVVGALVGVEYACEWLVSWFPFYWEVKTVFVLYLALPQTQGSTFIYDTYLAPYFVRNEAAIDRNIATAQNSIIVFAQEQLRALWNLARNTIIEAQNQPAQPPQAGGAPPPAAGSPTAVLGNLWRTYGASVIAGVTGAAGGVPPQGSAPQSQPGTPGTQPYARTPFSTSGSE